MTIRRRLVLTVAAIVTVLLAVGGAVTLLLLEDSLVSDLDRTLLERQEFVRRIPLGAVDFMSDEMGRRGGPFPDERDQAFLLTDGAGVLLGGLASGSEDGADPLPVTSNLDVAALATTGSPFTIAGGDLDYRAHVTAVAGTGTYLIQAVPMDGVAATLSAATRTLVSVGVFTLIALALSVGWVIRRGLRPIDDMIDTAGRIADGDLSQRIDVAEPDDEVGKLGEALNMMLGQIEEAVEVKTASQDRLRRFVSDASHELRNPLTSIRGYSELYRSGVQDPANVELAMTRIESEAKRMTGMVEDLLLLARLDQGRPLERDVVDVAAMARDAAADASAIQPDRPITLVVPDEPIEIQGDDAKLRQVLGNLLSNVQEHTDADAPVVITVSSTDELAVLVVADRGNGMAEQDARQAFERFHRANPHASGGNGLGLSIVRSIVEAHDGTVRLESTEGVGTTATVELPLAVRSAAGRP